jgi:hypothetical protein
MSGFDFDFEVYELTTEEYRQLIYEEVMLYHDEETLNRYIDEKKKFPDGILKKRFSKKKVNAE